MRSIHPLGKHLSTCSDPNNCQEYYDVLGMTPVAYSRYLRATSPLKTAEAAPDYTPPDPYELDRISKWSTR